MPRLVSTLLLVALLAGTAAAFAVTQGLKLERSPILAPRVDRVFSPVCDCKTREATIGFRLRKPDRVRVEIVDGDGDVVRELVEGRRLRRGTVTYTWNGRDDFGRFVPEGVYRPRVHLDDQRRTIVLPNEMRVDTTPPEVVSLEPVEATVTPGRRLVLRYRLSERAHALLFVGGERTTFTRSQQPNGRLVFVAPRARDYVLEVAAQDPAGNVGPSERVRVHARWIELARRTITVRAGRRFGVRVDADSTFTWRLRGTAGTAEPGLLVLRAPADPGRYRLAVELDGHRARATVIVRPR